MSTTTKPQDRYTKKVGARTETVKELRKEKHADRIKKAGLLDPDLAPIQTHGEDAARYDRLQREQIAAQAADNKELFATRDRVAGEMENVRNRLPAIIGMLDDAEATRKLAAWLAGLSFSKLRLKVSTREVPEGEAEAPKTETVKEMVERRDWPSWAEANKNFIDAVTEPGREAIVDAFAERGMPRDRLVRISTDCARLTATLGGTGRNKAVEATALEADAVAAQKVAWNRCKRMIRQCVEGDADLEHLFNRC